MLHSVCFTLIIWTILISSSLSCEFGDTVWRLIALNIPGNTPAKPSTTLKSYQDVKTAIKPVSHLLPILQPNEVVNVQNVMTNIMEFAGQEGRPYGMFIDDKQTWASVFHEFSIGHLQCYMGFKSAPNDKDNPGRNIPAKKYQYNKKSGHVPLLIHISANIAKNVFGAAKDDNAGGWYWMGVEMNQDITSIFGNTEDTKPYIFAFQGSQVLTLGDEPKDRYKESRLKAEKVVQCHINAHLSNPGNLNARIEYDDEMYSYYDQHLYYEYQQLLREERALDRLLKAYGNEEDDDWYYI